MQMKSSNWNNPAREVASTIDEVNNIVYGGLCCDVWVYSWVMMVNELPAWLAKLGKDMEGLLTKDEEKEETIGTQPKLIADQFLCIIKSRTLDLGSYMMADESLMTSPEFDWGLADDYETVQQFVRADRRMRAEIAEQCLEKSDALIERN